MTRLPSKEELELWKNAMKDVLQTNFNKLISIPKSKPIKKIEPVNPFVLDLHGYTLDNAFKEVQNFLHHHYYEQSKYVIIITGQSGNIYIEFPEWLTTSKIVRLIRSYEELQYGGAFKVKFKKI